MAQVKLTGAESVTWNLADLYPSTQDPITQAEMDRLRSMAQAFNEQYRGKIGQPTAEQLWNAVTTLEEIVDLLNKIMAFAYLNWVTQTNDEEAGRFLSVTRSLANEIQQNILFFGVEWRNAPPETAELMNTPTLSHYQHYLEVSRLSAPYTLSEPEEKIIAELTMSGPQGWQRYFDEVMSNARYEWRGESLNQSEILRFLHEGDRAMREEAANALTAGLHQTKHATTTVFNMLGLYKASMDKVRNYPHWLTERNLANEVADETVNALVNSVTSRYDIVSRYYRLIKRLLGYDELFDYDRYAPVLNETDEYDWESAREIVLNAFANFDQRMADISQEFFEKRWIDAAVAPYKRGGAFSHPVAASTHPYILVNYVGNSESVMTLAHELGHGVHQYLSRPLGHLNSDTPLTTAEMASTFGEMLVFDALMGKTSDPRLRLSMRLTRISDVFATVFRQIAMNRFEEGYHTLLRAEEQVTTAQLSEIWLSTQQAMFQDSVTLRPEYGIWWSYVPHFLHVPGYVYAYSFGELLVWTLYAKYQEQGADFPAKYLQLLSQGGSRYPHQLLAPLGVDLQDSDFWMGGLRLIDDMIGEAEKEAEALNYQL